MPSARELLAQADALMRRNRARAVDTDMDIPELTEVVTVSVPAAVPTALDEVPELIDAVEEIEIASIVEVPGDEDELSAWLNFDHDDTSGLPRAPDGIAGQIHSRAVSARDSEGLAAMMALAKNPDASALAVAPVARAAIAKADMAKEMPNATPLEMEPAPVDNWTRWEALGSEIRMQVLQRIDLFTDTELREQLNAQLQPIIDRASAEMAATINEEVGLLLRDYVAHAIELEIAKWRNGNA